MQKGQVILWIPALSRLGKERTSTALEQAFEERGIFYRQLFYPTGISPQGFPLRRDIILDIDQTLGFSFNRVTFTECEVNRGFYNLTQNTLTVGLKMNDVEEYPPIELAEYFKKCWLPHPAD